MSAAFDYDTLVTRNGGYVDTATQQRAPHMVTRSFRTHPTMLIDISGCATAP
jgi:hypothetical protein